VDLFLSRLQRLESNLVFTGYTILGLFGFKLEKDQGLDDGCWWLFEEFQLFGCWIFPKLKLDKNGIF
jgi:hypothetical protein